MNLSQAMMLVRQKHLEERTGITPSQYTEQYSKACEDFPAAMKLAHVYFALQFDKKD